MGKRIFITVHYIRERLLKLFNEKISPLRRGLFQEVTEKDTQSALKGIRFTLLKRHENLDEKKNHNGQHPVRDFDNLVQLPAKVVDGKLNSIKFVGLSKESQDWVKEKADDNNVPKGDLSD